MAKYVCIMPVKSAAILVNIVAMAMYATVRPCSVMLIHARPASAILLATSTATAILWKPVIVVKAT
jgi:hypothetical protein